MITDPNEKLLLEGLAKDDKTAIETIYKQNYNTIQAFILNNNGSVDDARDLFQEAIIVLYEKAKRGDFELSCQIKTYLYSVARRLWLKKLQSQQRFSGEINHLAEVVPVEDELERHNQKTQEFVLMDKALNSLGEPCKSLLEAYYLQKRNMEEIAGNFGYTNANNAKNQKYKCLMRLKKIFFAQYKNED